MELSLGPFLTCLTTSMILTVYFYYVLYRKKTFLHRENALYLLESY